MYSNFILGRYDRKSNLRLGFFNLCSKTYKRTSMQYVLSHIINYQYVSIDFAIILRVASQEL
jgi:hypothetical protein